MPTVMEGTHAGRLETKVICVHWGACCELWEIGAVCRACHPRTQARLWGAITRHRRQDSAGPGVLCCRWMWNGQLSVRKQVPWFNDLFAWRDRMGREWKGRGGSKARLLLIGPWSDAQGRWWRPMRVASLSEGRFTIELWADASRFLKSYQYKCWCATTMLSTIQH